MVDETVHPKRKHELRFAGLVVLGAGGAVILALASKAGWTTSDLRGIVASSGAFGPAVYLLASAVLPLLWVPRLGLATLAGALFGGPLGALLASVGGLLGVAVGFGVARGMGSDWVLRHNGAQRVQDLLLRHGVPLVVLGRVCPMIPCEAVSLACGVLNMSFGRYLAASAVAIVPTAVLYAVMGSSAAERQDVLATLLAGINAAMALVAALGLGRIAARAHTATGETR